MGRSCLFDIWQNKEDENGLKSVEFVGDNIEITSQCVTSYTDCSFPFWKIDNEYTYDDVLNADYIKDKDVDNTNCVFDGIDLMSLDTASNVLSALSEFSEYDIETLHLLKKQQVLSNNIQSNARNESVGYGYNGYMLLVASMLILSALIVKYFMHQSKHILYQNQKNHHLLSNKIVSFVAQLNILFVVS